MDTYGYLYRESFNPLDPSCNMIPNDGDGCGQGQFWLSRFLFANTTYILVVSTSISAAKGTKFSIAAAGGATVSFTRLGEFNSFQVLITAIIQFSNKYDLKGSLDIPPSPSSVYQERRGKVTDEVTGNSLT